MSQRRLLGQSHPKHTLHHFDYSSNRDSCFAVRDDNASMRGELGERTGSGCDEGDSRAKRKFPRDGPMTRLATVRGGCDARIRAITMLTVVDSLTASHDAESAEKSANNAPHG